MPVSLPKIPLLLSLALTLLFFAGCKSHPATIIQPTIDVNTPVVGWGLRKLDPKDYPDMRSAWGDKTNLEQAINKSLVFLAKPSTAKLYPSANAPEDTITHDQIVATLYDVKGLLHKDISADQFQQEVLARYDVYTSKGYDDKGDVWFTGYYTPIYQGSLTPTAEFKYPVYRRPPDLHSDPLTGEVIGSYPTRKELLASGKLKGLEFVYFKKPIEPFIIQVQGSAKVILPNGQPLFLGYAGHNGGKHVGLGSQLGDAGKIDKKHLSLPAVMEYFDQHPEELNEYVMRDDRFVFLKEYSTEWPAGSLGVQVTGDRSLATDKSIFPRASLAFIDVQPEGDSVARQRLVLDQDSGGAIRAAGRADIYMGIGEAAGRLAGHQYAQGRLYYLFLKPTLMNPADYPALKPAAAPKNVTSGSSKKANPTKGTPSAPAAPSGSDDMFPGAVKK